MGGQHDDRTFAAPEEKWDLAAGIDWSSCSAAAGGLLFSFGTGSPFSGRAFCFLAERTFQMYPLQCLP